jgi:anaerobic selenocysteine-containing dehydrogenase
MTDIYTELAARLEILPAYNSIINRIFRVSEQFELSPTEKYSVDEIVDRLCRSATSGEHGLDWFKETGGVLWPASELGNYLHANMVETGARYELPYQGRLKVIGEQLEKRLKEVGIDWWGHQASIYSQGLPKWEDFAGIYREVFQASPEYDMWLLTHRIQMTPGCQNLDVPWTSEIGQDVLDFPGVLINPQTAKEKGIKDGDRVCLESLYGKTYGRAVLSETVGFDVLVVLGFSHYVTPVSKDLEMPNPSELERIDVRLISPDGSSSEHSFVKIYKV